MARRIERGDIWMYRFAPPDKRRPVVVLSRTSALGLLRTATVAPITGSIRGAASEVLVGVEEGLKKPSAVSLDHIITVPQEQLRRYVGHLSSSLMERVCEAVNIALGCT